jgi:3'-phosphoadenosine 5'-phosphosulfate sulfotransferase (PAPS reductase)/FAD synthetase
MVALDRGVPRGLLAIPMRVVGPPTGRKPAPPRWHYIIPAYTLMDMNPYKIEPPFYVSFSGGRTSGYLLRHVLDAWGGTLPAGGHVLFANTGKEHDATYDFIETIGRQWCEVTWIEWSPAGYEIQTPSTADRSGKPFADLIAKRNYLPNPITRFCTSDLKVKPMQRFMKAQGYDEFTTVIGLRADESRRVAKLRSDPTRDIAMPLADAGVHRDQIIAWWKSQPFDLHLPNDDAAFGNCDLCFLKGASRIERVIRAEPHRAAWWAEQERLVDARFRKDRPGYAQMLTQITVQGELFQHLDDTTIPCDCTE